MQQGVAEGRHGAVRWGCGWGLDKNDRYTVPVYEFNVDGLKDEPKPDNPRMTGAQRSARYRMRKKGALVWAGLGA